MSSSFQSDEREWECERWEGGKEGNVKRAWEKEYKYMEESCMYFNVYRALVEKNIRRLATQIDYEILIANSPIWEINC